MKLKGRERRHRRIVKKLKGTNQRPRVVVFRSKKHFYAQVIDDSEQKVITGISTLNKEFKEKNIKANNTEGAKVIGKLFAEKLKSLGIERIAFDRAGYKYHGRVRAFAEGTREGGLIF